jgi:hypothetical protein
MTSYIVVTHFGVGRINKAPAKGRRAAHKFVPSLKWTPTAPEVCALNWQTEDASHLKVIRSIFMTVL